MFGNQNYNRISVPAPWRAIAFLVLLLIVAVSVVACSGTPSPTPTPSQNTGATPSGSIEAAWIEPQVDDTMVSIPTNTVDTSRNVHFKLTTEDGDTHYMAYTVNGIVHVRANVCPPCRSIGYSLDDDVLVCDRCATAFNAITGDGITGACVDYPKAQVPYEVIDDTIVMKKSDLIAAYKDTLAPGWP